jgi:predicted MFS family arabinose efflux permease
MIFFLTDRSFDDRQKDPALPETNFDWGVARSLAGQKQFWLIFFAVFAVGFVDQALIQHQVLYLQEDLGIDPTYVAAIVSGIGVIAIVARPLVGGLYDGLSIKGVSVSYLFLGISCVLALGVLSPYLLAMFVVFRAIGHSAVLLDTLVLAKHRFGLTNIGILLGIFTAAVNLGFAVGPPVVARLYAVTGSYTVPFAACSVLAVIAALTLLPVKPAYWLNRREPVPGGPKSL